MTHMDSTNARGKHLTVSDPNEEFAAFDALPKPIKDAIRQSPLKYSCVDVLAAYREMMDEDYSASRSSIIRAIVSQLGRADG